MKDGGFERHLRRITKTYQQRRDHAVEVINSSEQFDFSIPDGGMALWLKLKSPKAHILAEQCRQNDIYVQHEANFQLLEKYNTNQYIRLGFSGLNQEQFVAGFNRISNLISTY